MTEAITQPDASNSAPAPTADAPAPKPRICPNCSGEFYRPTKGPGGHKRYCSETCRREWDARAAVEGKAIITLAKIWAANTKNETGNKAMSRILETVRALSNIDEEEGRHRLKGDGPLAAYVSDVVNDGFRYIDRRRR